MAAAMDTTKKVEKGTQRRDVDYVVELKAALEEMEAGESDAAKKGAKFNYETVIKKYHESAGLDKIYKYADNYAEVF
jgi:hypothetical protein